MNQIIIFWATLAALCVVGFAIIYVVLFVLDTRERYRLAHLKYQAHDKHRLSSHTKSVVLAHGLAPMQLSRRPGADSRHIRWPFRRQP